MMNSLVKRLSILSMLCISTMQGMGSDPKIIQKNLQDMSAFVAAIRDIFIDPISGTLKVPLPPSVITSSINEIIQPLFDLVITASGAGAEFIKFVETKFKDVQAQFDCLALSDEELKSGRYKGCESRGCRDKRSCVASTLRMSVDMLRPFTQNIFGKVISVTTLRDGKQDISIQKGILPSLDALMKVAIDLMSKIHTPKKGSKSLGKGESDILATTGNLLEQAKKVENMLIIVLSDLLDALELIALVIGGPDSLPHAKPEDKALVKQNVVTISDDFF